MDVMGPLALLSALVGIFVFWIFMAFPPAYAEKSQVSFFNRLVLGVTALFILVYVFNIAVFVSGPQLETYRKFFIVLGVFGIEAASLTFFFLIRNFWLFKPRRRGGGF